MTPPLGENFPTMVKPHLHAICDDKAEGLYTSDQKAECCKCAGHDCNAEHVACNNLKLVHKDDMGVTQNVCVECQKQWFGCAFCKMDDFETEEEVTEHMTNRHYDDIVEYENMPILGEPGDE